MRELNTDLIYENITENIDEVIGSSMIKKILSERNLKIYWGTTPSAIPNLNYLIPLIQLVNFMKHNCKIKILFADMHAYLDSMKSSFEILSLRTDIHEQIIKMLLTFLNVNTHDITFVQGSSYQLTSEFTMDVYKFNASCTVSEVKKAGINAVIQSEDPLMTSLLYPTLQALDIEYLECDVYFGDINQKEICMLANNVLDKIGYPQKGFFLNNLYDDLKCMEKITFIDSYEIISRKINNTKFNILIHLIDIILFEICEIKNITFDIKDYKFSNIEEVINKYILKEINQENIKKAIIDFIDYIIEPIRIEFLNHDSQMKLKEAKYK